MSSERESLKGVLPPPKPSDYIGAADYWPESRFSNLKDVRFPRLSYRPTLDAILRVFWQSRENGSVPMQISEGERLPRIQRDEGMLKLVIDSYRRDEVRGLLTHAHMPIGFAGKTVSEVEFDARAHDMVTDPWYDKESVRVRRKFKDGDWVVHEDVRREVAYMIATPDGDIWFTGFYSGAMKRKPNSFKLPLTFIRLLDAEFYGRRVGEINMQDSRCRVDALAWRQKVATAFVYPSVSL